MKVKNCLFLLLIKDALFTRVFFFSPTDIQTRDPTWYQALTQALDEEQGKQLQDIGTLADQRRAAHGMAKDLGESS